MTGNHALALRRAALGHDVLLGLPHDAASPLLHWLVTKEEEYGIVAKQTEDEISAVLMAIGASAAARAR